MKLEKILRNFVITSSLIASLASPIHAQDTQQKLTSKEKIELYKWLYPSEFKKNQQETKQSSSWDKREKLMALSDIFFDVADAYQSAHIPKGFQEGGKFYLFNWNNSPFGAARFIGNHPNMKKSLVYHTITDAVWFAACDLAPKYVTNRFLPEKYNKYVRKAMLGVSLSSAISNVYNNERITGGIIFRF